MLMKKLFSNELWSRYVEKVEEDFHLKTYPHFDPYFDFSRFKDKVKSIISDPSLTAIKTHGFIPFVKTIQKTPRYRWQEGEEEKAGYYALETKSRPISFASHFDTYIYGFYSFAINQLYQEYIHSNGFQEVILAYRDDLNGKCNIQFAKEAFDEIKLMINSGIECSAVALDIKGYFDNIDHAILKKMWCKVIDVDDLPLDQYAIFRSLTKYSYVNLSTFLKHFNINLLKIEKDQRKKYKERKNPPKSYKSLFDIIPDDTCGNSFNEKMEYLRKRKLVTINSRMNAEKKRVLSNKGIPQGSAMSALLSNIYLLDFDRQIFEKGQKEDFVYRRYCDDILIICHSGEVNKIKAYIVNLISNDYKLVIQDKKTEVIDFKSSKNGMIRSYKRNHNEELKTFDPLPNDDKNFKNLQYLGFEFNGQDIFIRPGSLSRYFRKMKARVVKTVSMAYSPNSKSDRIFKQQMYSRYSHFGRRNFLTYAKNASKKYYTNSKGERKEGMDSSAIRKQIAAHMRILQQEIQKTSNQRATQKGVSKVKS